MAFCRYCGKKVDDTANNCPFCGGAQFAGQSAGGAQEAQNTNPVQPAPAAQSGFYDQADIEKTKLVCAISYVYILFFLPLVVYPDSRYGKFHANQALVLFITSAVLGVIASTASGIFGALPFIPGFLKVIVSSLLNTAAGGVSLAGMIFGIVNALNGNAKELPIIGKFNLINK